MFDPPLAADGKRVPASTHVTRLDLSSRSFGEASTEASTNSTSLGTKERL
jgi:hypothetical protein